MLQSVLLVNQQTLSKFQLHQKLLVQQCSDYLVKPQGHSLSVTIAGISGKKYLDMG